jgi:hypothetical protein
MKGKGVLVIVLSIGVAFAWAQGAGLAAAWGIGGQSGVPQGDAARDAVDNVSSNSPAQTNPVEGDAATENGESDIISLVLDGSLQVAAIVGNMVLVAPILTDLTAPVWFAAPLGSLAVFAATMLIIQFITNRVLR